MSALSLNSEPTPPKDIKKINNDSIGRRKILGVLGRLGWLIRGYIVLCGYTKNISTGCVQKSTKKIDRVLS